MLRVTKNIERTLQDIVNEVNRLSKIISSTTQGKAKEKEEVRIVKTGEGNYQIEFKHNDGWVKSDSASATGFKLKEK